MLWFNIRILVKGFTFRFRAVFPRSLKKRHFRHFFWTPADRIFENWHLQIWMQFLPLEKISQNKISLFFQKCAGDIFTIQAVLRTQHGYTAGSGEKSSDAV